MTETTTEPAPPAAKSQPDSPPKSQPDSPPEKDWQAEAEKWKALARKHETEAQSGKTAAKRLAEIEEANKSETEKAITAARREAEEAVRAEVRRDRVLDRVEVLAAKGFADAEDARLHMAGRVNEFVGKDGQIDAEAIQSALTQLLKDKPHLAVPGDGRPHGNVDQGVRSSTRSEPEPGLGRLRAAYATSKSP